MKLLYYAVVLSSKHGGSNHANQFVKYASAHPAVNSVVVFPKQQEKLPTVKVKKQVWIKKSRMLLIPRFLRRNKHFFHELIAYIEVQKPDVLIMRPDHNFLQLKKLRSRFPHLLLAAEINSSSFDESYFRIPFKRFFQKIERKTYSLCDLNFFVTKELRNSVMMESIDRNRDLVIYNGTEPGKFSLRKPGFNYRNDIGLSDEETVIGYMGTLDLHKKMHLLIESFSELKVDFPDLLLLIVGDGPDRGFIQQQIDALGLRSSVKITGWVDYSKIENYLFAMDIAIHHHSNSYCCPLKIFDYMAAGLPTIAPNISFVQGEFEKDIHLAVTDPNIESIKKSILKFLENPEWSKRVAAKGRDFVINNFTWEKSANQIIDQILLKLGEEN